MAVGYATRVVNGKETRRQWAFHKIEALYTWLGSLNQQGWSVYHANAAFRQEKIWDAAKQRWQRRTHANVRALKILFADIDTRESKPDAPYVDRVEAYEAVIAFCQAAGLPMPLIVSSGGGLHCYWILETELTLEQWEPVARGLKAAMAHFGLQADPSRTSDASSVLRTPGTHHHKSGRLVESGELAGPYPLSAFEHLKQFATEQPIKRFVRKQLSKSTAARPSDGQSPIAEAMCADIYDPSDPAKVVKACRQLKGFAENPSRHSEPFHYAASGVFGHCTDGEQFYLGLLDDEWKEAGRDKLNQWLGGGWGPTTCQRFEELNAGGCAGCPFRGEITSPIVLGRPDTRDVDCRKR